jgi:hypothetical protein
MKLSDTTESYRQALALALQERSELLAALNAVRSQCAGHADEFSGRVWTIADAAIAKVEGAK